MAPETPEETVEAPEGQAAPKDDAGRRRRFRPSQMTILVTVAALGFNIAALAIVVKSVNNTRDQMFLTLAETRAEARAAVEEPEPPPEYGGGVDELLALADELEQLGQVEGARTLRANAHRQLVARSEEDGAFDYAIRLLESGHAREARRALYRIIARADQPGTRWGELAARARFLIGKSLSAEADQREIEQGGAR